MRTWLALALVLVVTPVGAQEPPRELLDRWVRTQNTQDFAGYSALYAPDFSGVRRSGPRVVRLERAAWLKERKRMFGRPLTVEVSDVTIDAGGTIRFTQKFATPTYSDVGRKELVLAHAPSGWQIAHEEQLASRIDAEQQAVATEKLPLESFAFVDHGELVLDPTVTVEAAKRLVQGTLARRVRDYEVELRGVVPTKRLGAEAAALIGKRVRVYDGAAPVCEAVVGDHASLRVLRDQDAGNTPRPKRVPVGSLEDPDQLNKAIRLVVSLVIEEGNCTKGRWARAQDRPLGARAFVKVGNTTESVRGRTQAAMLRFAEAKTAQADYAKARAELVKDEEIKRPAPARWEELPDVFDVFAVDVSLRGGVRATLAYAHAAFGDPCGAALFIDYWGLFELEAGASEPLVRGSRSAEHTASYITPVAVADLDGDGVDEIIVGPSEADGDDVDVGVMFLRDGRYRLGPVLAERRTTCHC